MKTYVVVVSILLVSAVTVAVSTDPETSKTSAFSATVELNITGEELKNEVYSYMTRELRSLGDVTVVNRNGQWAIDIVALGTPAESGHASTVALSCAVRKPLPQDVLAMFVLRRFNPEGPLSESGYQKFMRYMQHFSIPLSHTLSLGMRADLQRICRGIIIDFDADCLKVAREEHQEAIRKLEELEEVDLGLWGQP